MLRKILELLSSPEREEKPINFHDTLHRQISELAYLKWEGSGRPEGKDDEFWREAEKELRSRTNQVRGL
jgi:hypothetical protein